jgi:hypothetical protein
MARSVMVAGWYRPRPEPGERGGGEGGHLTRDVDVQAEHGPSKVTGLSGAVPARALRRRPPLLSPPL